jgi:hypothetical protein
MKEFCIRLKSCKECPFRDISADIAKSFCKKYHNCVIEDIDKLPDWCPLDDVIMETPHNPGEYIEVIVVEGKDVGDRFLTLEINLKADLTSSRFRFVSYVLSAPVNAGDKIYPKGLHVEKIALKING